MHMGEHHLHLENNDEILEKLQGARRAALLYKAQVQTMVVKYYG